MSNDFKPGDVALVTPKHGDPEVCVLDSVRVWVGGSLRASGERVGISVRRLVVIDPEDREQVERFREIASRMADEVPYDFAPGDYTAAMQAALREFAEPAPVKPPEPTGLGAVVVDADGHEWVNLRDHSISEHRRPWMAVRNPEQWRDYADITAVTVLSEGVPS